MDSHPTTIYFPKARDAGNSFIIFPFTLSFAWSCSSWMAIILVREGRGSEKTAPKKTWTVCNGKTPSSTLLSLSEFLYQLPGQCWGLSPCPSIPHLSYFQIPSSVIKKGGSHAVFYKKTKKILWVYRNFGVPIGRVMWTNKSSLVRISIWSLYLKKHPVIHCKRMTDVYVL